tara:strand:+ start:1879 stop:2205 length:327 start_codon:yes stop_codon:yes gene_type:complete
VDDSKIRIVMLEDVISPDGNLVDNLLELSDGDIVSKARPNKCKRCGGVKILGIEIMGAYDGILFWECDICENTILRFKKENTEKYLENAKGLWTNPSDWGYVKPSEFN